MAQKTEIYKHLSNHFKERVRSSSDMTQIHDIDISSIVEKYPDISLDRMKVLAMEAGLHVVESVEEAKTLPYGQMVTYVVLIDEALSKIKQKE